MIRVICRHELQQQFRSKSFWLLTPIIVILTVVVAAAHWQQQRQFAQSQAHWQAVNDELWRSQPDRHPHRVAHYGSLVFRQPSPLAFIESGVTPFVGNALYLEAHRQNNAALAQFAFSASQLRLGHASASTVVLVLLPLMLIAIGFNSLSRERESNRQRFLLSLGVRPRQQFIGKGLAYSGIAAAYLLLLFAIAGAFILKQPHLAHEDTWAALVLLFFLYTGYSLLWVVMVLAISWVSANGAQSLARALGAWLVLVILLPKTVPLIAERIHPYPDRALFETELESALKNVGDSHDPDDPYFEAFREETLKRFGVERVEDLPVNWNGLLMAEGERLTSEIFQKQYAALNEVFEQHSQVTTLLGFASPYLLASTMSEQLAGTDARGFSDFERQAESYRYRLIQALNRLHTDEIHRNNDRFQRVSRNHWQSLPMFEYQEPPLSQRLPGKATIAGALFWILIAYALFAAVVRTRVPR